jgi:hypothetical protein
MALILKINNEITDPQNAFSVLTAFGVAHPITGAYVNRLALNGYSVNEEIFNAINNFIIGLAENNVISNVLEIYPMIGDSLAQKLIKLKPLEYSTSLINGGTASMTLDATGLKGGNDRYLKGMFPTSVITDGGGFYMKATEPWYSSGVGVNQTIFGSINTDQANDWYRAILVGTNSPLSYTGFQTTWRNREFTFTVNFTSTFTISCLHQISAGTLTSRVWANGVPLTPQSNTVGAHAGTHYTIGLFDSLNKETHLTQKFFSTIRFFMWLDKNTSPAAMETINTLASNFCTALGK